MAGGLGRAQGGYDEMVFRAMVRDGAHFYDPLGLESRGTRVDFQVGANAYLYGTRFITWLAYAHSPEKVVAWLRRDEGSALLRRPVRAGVRHAARRGLAATGSPSSASSSAATSPKCASIRSRRNATLAPTRAGLGLARVSTTRRAASSTARSAIPGVVEHVGALNTRDGSVRRLADIKGAMLYHGHLVRLRSRQRARPSTPTTTSRCRDLMAVDVDTGEERMLLEGRAHRRDRVQSRRPLADRRAPPRTGSRRWCASRYPYDELGDGAHFPYGVVPYDLDVSPDGRLLSASMSRGQRRPVPARVGAREAARRRRHAAVASSASASRCPRASCSRRTAATSTAAATTPASRTSSATKSRPATSKAVSNAETGFFRPVPLADGRLVVLQLHRRGIRAGDHRAAAARGRERDHLPRHRGGREKHPVVTTWQVPPAEHRRRREAGRRRPGPTARSASVQLLNALSGAAGLQGLPRASATTSTSRIRSASRISASPPRTRRRTSLPDNERGHVDIDGRYLGWRAGLAWNRSDFYDLFGPTKRSRKGYAAKLGYDQFLIFDEPRQARRSATTSRTTTRSTRCPDAQNVATTFDRLFTGEVGAALHRRAPLARRRRRREGRHLDGSRHGASHAATRR